MKPMTFRRGQSTLEYAIIIVVVVGALIAMQWYIKGGYQGRLRQASDDMGEQFSPTQIAMNYTTTTNSTTNEEIGGGISKSTFNHLQNKVGSEALSGLNALNYQR